MPGDNSWNGGKIQVELLTGPVQFATGSVIRGRVVTIQPEVFKATGIVVGLKGHEATYLKKITEGFNVSPTDKHVFYNGTH